MTISNLVVGSVCVVAHHPLAARFLQGIISPSTQAVIVRDEATLLAEKQAGGLVSVRLYLIDAETLVTPLSALVQSIRQVHPDSRILCTGNRLSTEAPCDLLLAGEHGYVSFDDVDQSLTAAIEAVMRGRLWIEAQVLEQFALYASQLAARRVRGGAFTEQERSVIDLLQRRLSNKEIGAALNISERTARFHLSSIFMKLGVHDRHSAIDLIKSRNLLGRDRVDSAQDSGPSGLAFVAQGS